MSAHDWNDIKSYLNAAQQRPNTQWYCQLEESEWHEHSYYRDSKIGWQTDLELDSGNACCLRDLV